MKRAGLESVFESLFFDRHFLGEPFQKRVRSFRRQNRRGYERENIGFAKIPCEGGGGLFPAETVHARKGEAAGRGLGKCIEKRFSFFFKSGFHIGESGAKRFPLRSSPVEGVFEKMGGGDLRKNPFHKSWDKKGFQRGKVSLPERNPLNPFEGIGNF